MESLPAMSDVASLSSEHALPLLVAQPANTDVEMLPVDADATPEVTMTSVEEQEATDRRPTRPTNRCRKNRPSDRSKTDRPI